jgi:hypothetical protein
MTDRELAMYCQQPVTEQSSWYFRRLLAKDVARACWTALHGESLYPADLETECIDTDRYLITFRDARHSTLPEVIVRTEAGMLVAAASTGDIHLQTQAIPKKGNEDIYRLEIVQRIVQQVWNAIPDRIEWNTSEARVYGHDLPPAGVIITVARREQVLVALCLGNT